jgi:hypothetical protein
MDFGCFSRRTGHNFRTLHAPSAFGTFAAHKMTATAAPAFESAGSGNFDPFAQPLMSFLFRHLTGSFKTIEKVLPLQYAAKLGTKKYELDSLRYLRRLVNTITWRFSQKREIVRFINCC